MEDGNIILYYLVPLKLDGLNEAILIWVPEYLSIIGVEESDLALGYAIPN